MSGLIKNKDDVKRLREGGAILAAVVREISEMVRPGVMTDVIDRKAEALIRQAGGRPAFLHYKAGGDTPFNSTICACINEEVVHAPAHPGRELKEGDLFSIDIGMEYKERYTDMAVTLPVGEISMEHKRLMDVTRRALQEGIAAIKPDESINAIGIAIQNYVEAAGFQVVRSLVGHGVGYAVHEDPQVPNFDDKRAKKIIMKPGMVLALEPMVTQDAPDVLIKDDKWTIVAQDGKTSAHFEHTVVVTENGVEILTEET